MTDLAAMPRYQSVNGQWPDGTNDGRTIKPTPQEALTGFRRLFRRAFGRPYRGRLILATGNRRTWYGGGSRTIRVNPDEKGGGWHEIVHSVSHMASNSLHGENHGPRHAFIERDLIAYAVAQGFLDGKLRREPKAKSPRDPAAERRQHVIAAIARWQSKKKRAETALRKLERRRRYYEKMPQQMPGQV